MQSHKNDGYNVIVTGRHVHVTEGMKQHAIDRLAKLEHVGGHIIDVHVSMDIQKNNHLVEILLKYGHTTIQSKVTTQDMYAAIDLAVEKIRTQMKKYRDKIKAHNARDVVCSHIPEHVYAVENEVDAVQDVLSFPKIVAVEQRKMSLLTEDEAIMRMELSERPFMIYQSEATKKISIIYRKEDGNYGVVQPE